MLWNAAGNITYMGCQWVITVLVTVIGGLTDAGVLSIAMSISATLQTLAAFGIRNFQVSDIRGQYTDSCYVSFRILTCAVTLPVCLSVALLGQYFGGQLVAVLWFMIFRLAECFSDVLHGIAQKNDRLDIAGKSFAMKGIGLLVCFLGVYLLTGRLNAGLACMAIFSCGVTLLYDLPSVRRLSDFSFAVPIKESMGLAKQTLPLCVYMFLSAAIATLPKLILERECGENVLGAYSSIFAPAMLLQAATGYLYIPFATTLAEQHAKSDHRSFLRLLMRITAVILAVFAVISVPAYLFGEFALVLVFGEELRAYVYLLIPILIVNLVISYLGLFSMAVIILRSFRVLLCGYAVGFAGAVLLPGPAIRYFGVNGTSYALIAAACAVILILLVRIVTVRGGKPVTEERE